MPENVQTSFSRIAQEALNNVAKHAQAKLVSVSLSATLLTPDSTGEARHDVKLVIQAWVGSASYCKGQSHFLQGVIIEPLQQEMTLKARCLGSSALSYRVEVTIDDEGITEAESSCPVGAGGHCEYVAALLLTWLDNPEAFEESAGLETSLEQRSKPELIALIRQMLQRYPDLEYLLELPSPTAGTDKTDINPEIIRRPASPVFADNEGDGGWRDLFETAHDLDELLNMAGVHLGFGRTAGFPASAFQHFRMGCKMGYGVPVHWIR